MDGIGSDSNGILIIGNTNLPHSLDRAFRRRFEKRIYVGLPNQDERYELVKQFIKSYDHALSDDDIKHLAERTVGFAGSDLETLVKATHSATDSVYGCGKYDNKVEDGEKRLRRICMVRPNNI